MTERGAEPRAIVVLTAGATSRRLGVIERTTCGDLALIDDLLRMRLLCARQGWSMQLIAVDERLRELVELVGVADLLRGDG